METILIKEILSRPADGKDVLVRGWVRTKRDSKNLVFLEINDGSCFKSIQLTFDRTKGLSAETEAALERAATGASIEANGALVPS
ncbi:MAG: OB-fold nucleic acid binding domain-containing protein, partial [Treponemataceae bacterium]